MKRAILQLIDSRQAGGIETHIYQLSKALIERGYPVTVMFMRDYGPHPLKQQLDTAGIHWQIAPSNLFELLRFLRNRAVLLNTHGYKAGIAGRMLARVAGIPVVSTFHSGDSGKGRVRLYHWLDQLTSHLAPAMAVSDEIAAQLPVLAHRICNFTDSKPACFESSSNTIGFVGRLSHEKGPDLFCQAIESSSAAQGELYGDGPLHAILQQRYEAQIRFHGFVEDMSARWPTIGLLCISSRAEGLPLVAIEAMARGIPVVASAVGGLPQLIKHNHNGFLVPAGDVGTLTASINRWLAMPPAKRSKLSHQARQTIERNFTGERALPAILSVYHRAAPELQPQ